ncbi:MAG: polysaccharide pyruvyl transferase CsaB [bacterium]|nr:polysaccharide pyruvyl transferase CsaB [bacterium]
MKRQRLVVSGFYGAGNAGDEAILDAMITSIRKLMPDAVITVLSFDPAGTAGQYGVEAVSRYSPGAVISALRRADLLISGGGGLLQDITGPSSVPYYLGLVALSHLVGTPAVMLGQSIGPLNRSVTRLLARLLLPLASRAVLRDEASALLLAGLGYPRDRIRVTADLAYAGIAPDKEDGRRLLEADNFDCRQPWIAVSLRPWGDNRHLSVAGRALGKFAVASGCRLLFMPFQASQDRDACREACRHAGTGHVFGRDVSSADLKNIIAGADFLVGMRFHSLIFAAMGAVPALALEYDPKVAAAVDQLGIPTAGRVGELEESGLFIALQDAWGKREATVSRLENLAAELRNRAEAGIAEVISI